MAQRSVVTRNEAASALRAYRNGGDRDQLLYSLRACIHRGDADDDVIDGFFLDRKGADIMLPTLVGDDLDAFAAADALSYTEATTSALMLVLDEELVLFMSHDTFDDGHPTLVLTCSRDPAVEKHLQQYDDDEDDDGDDEELRWVYSPFCLPTKAGSVDGGSGFQRERLAGYLGSFEPDADGTWNGHQVIAASAILSTDDYTPSEKICLDPPVLKKRYGGKMAWCDEKFEAWRQNPPSPVREDETVQWDPRKMPPSYSSDQCYYEVFPEVAVLPLESTIKQRTDATGAVEGDEGDEGMDERNKMTEKEQDAMQYYVSLLMAMYRTIPLDDLPEPGHLRRIKLRQSIVLFRQLVQRGRASFTDGGEARLRFVFVDATADIFSGIVRHI